MPQFGNKSSETLEISLIHNSYFALVNFSNLTILVPVECKAGDGFYDLVAMKLLLSQITLIQNECSLLS